MAGRSCLDISASDVAHFAYAIFTQHKTSFNSISLSLHIYCTNTLNITDTTDRSVKLFLFDGDSLSLMYTVLTLLGHLNIVSREASDLPMHA